MLAHIHIRNFALIQSLDLDLQKGFTVITGETGSGKSILLGALGLVLGERADLSVVRDKHIKCIVEATFYIVGANARGFLKDHDLLVDDTVIIRREILPGGRSRAFINDTPAQLAQLKEFGELMVDIHVQNQNLQLAEQSFRYDLLDGFCGGVPLRREYLDIFRKTKQIQKELEQLRNDADAIRKDKDYNQFLLDEFSEVDWSADVKELEDEMNVLEHAVDLKSTLTQVDHSIEGEEGISEVLGVVRTLLSGFTMISKVRELNERIESVLIEIRDVHAEIVSLNETTEADPERLEYLSKHVDMITQLFRKHKVEWMEELKRKKEELEARVFQADHIHEVIDTLEREWKAQHTLLLQKGEALRKLRRDAAGVLERNVSEMLADLQMPDTMFKVDLQPLVSPGEFGLDRIVLEFSANKGVAPLPLEKAASGGERSRVMLVLKAIMSRNLDLPTLILDEIDNGVSGEVAARMASLMRNISGQIQVLAISHLPQIAAKGTDHLKVEKNQVSETTETRIIRLDESGRTVEIAKMLSGSEPGKGAIQNAKELLKGQPK